MTTTQIGTPVSLVTGANKGNRVGNGASAGLLAREHRVYLAARDVRAWPPRLRRHSWHASWNSTSRAMRRCDAPPTSSNVKRVHLDVLVNNAGITGPLRDVHEIHR